MIDVKIKLLRKTSKKPKYMTEGAVGMDVFADLHEGEGYCTIVPPRGSIVVGTGIAVELPLNYEFQNRPRSGLMFKNDIMGGLGTIDSDYRGEIKVKLFNLSDENFVINHGDRIAQLVLQKVEKCNFLQVDELSETARAEGGFGHTGKQ